MLVIRAWLEEEFEENALRARITQTPDVSHAGTVETVAGTEAEILATVRTWLRSLAGPEA